MSCLLQPAPLGAWRTVSHWPGETSAGSCRQTCQPPCRPAAQPCGFPLAPLPGSAALQRSPKNSTAWSQVVGLGRGGGLPHHLVGPLSRPGLRRCALLVWILSAAGETCDGAACHGCRHDDCLADRAKTGANLLPHPSLAWTVPSAESSVSGTRPWPDRVVRKMRGFRSSTPPPPDSGLGRLEWSLVSPTSSSRPGDGLCPGPSGKANQWNAGPPLIAPRPIRCRQPFPCNSGRRLGLGTRGPGSSPAMPEDEGDSVKLELSRDPAWNVGMRCLGHGAPCATQKPPAMLPGGGSPAPSSNWFPEPGMSLVLPLQRRTGL